VDRKRAGRVVHGPKSTVAADGDYLEVSGALPNIVTISTTMSARKASKSMEIVGRIFCFCFNPR
jgi:hypothetical protein